MGYEDVDRMGWTCGFWVCAGWGWPLGKCDPADVRGLVFWIEIATVLFFLFRFYREYLAFCCLVR